MWYHGWERLKLNSDPEIKHLHRLTSAFFTQKEVQRSYQYFFIDLRWYFCHLLEIKHKQNHLENNVVSVKRPGLTHRRLFSHRKSIIWPSVSCWHFCKSQSYLSGKLSWKNTVQSPYTLSVALFLEKTHKCQPVSTIMLVLAIRIPTV